MESLLSQLNNQQRAAVVYDAGPALIIAGAGAGKTRVLTYKIAYLLLKGALPQNVLALTFTNKAAREMKERIAKLIGWQYARGLWMGTFHSVFSRILRAEAEKLGFSSTFTIMDSSDSKNLIKSIIKEYQLDDKVYKPSKVQGIISRAKNALISSVMYAQNRDIADYDSKSKMPLIKDIYKEYTKRLKKSNAMDFDDLLFHTNILFRDFPEVLSKYQNIFEHILVDEYQDTNFSQYLAIKMLGEKNRKVYVVGDDAQSIYSFRGANISNILKFQETYPEAKLFKLERNYRSTQNIVNVANSLIKQNKEQIPKNTFSENTIGEMIEIVSAFSDFEEGAIVANKIIELRSTKGLDYSQFVILYRTNAQSRIFEEVLRKKNIPYKIYGGLSFYQRKEIKDIIAYFKIIINPNDEEAFKRIINYPVRGIGATTIKKIIEASKVHDVSLWQAIGDIEKYGLSVNSGTAKKLTLFKELILSFIKDSSELTAYEIASRVIKETGIAKDAYQDKSPESMSLQENIQELLNGIHAFCEQRIEEGSEDIRIWDFLSEVSLLTDQDGKEDELPRVTLMTIHASKGLEFKNVFIVGVEEDLFPSALAKYEPKELEEERRLFYVAITRAEEYCMISYAKMRFRHGTNNFCNPSRFLSDLDHSFTRIIGGDKFSGLSSRHTLRENQAAPIFKNEAESKIGRNEFKKPIQKLQPIQEAEKRNASAEVNINGLTKGMKVKHSRFGIGQILSLDSENMQVEVEFENLGIKKLLLRFAKLEILE